MSRYAAELEDELEFEHEGECELEGECEFEGEYEDELEGEQFLGTLRRVGGWLATPGSPQRRLALAAARAVLNRAGAAAGPALGGAIRGIGSVLPAQEMEYEFENELLLDPRRRAFALPTMAHMSSMAARARNPAEAEAFLGALLPIAARVIPRVAPVVARALPQLARGVAQVGRTLLRSPVTRPLIRAAPQIVTGTIRNIAGQVAAGRPITAQGAVRTLARQTYRTLGQPTALRRAIRTTAAADRAYHRQTGGCACRCGN